MRILVTGGAGFVGRELVRLLADDHQVAVLDNLRFGEDRLSADDRAKVDLHVADLRDADATAKVVADVDPEVVIHLAAIHYIPECEQEPGMTVATNVAGTVNLLTALTNGQRIVFASTGAVYAPSDEPHDEELGELLPSDIYGWSKLHGEHYVRHYAATRGVAGVIVRLFNAVGPGETNPHLFPEVVAQLKAGRTALDLGNLTSRRDYVHVADIARGLAACALSGDVPPGTSTTVNLGTGLHHSADEILERVREASGIDFEVRQDPARLRPVDRPLLVARIDRIAEQFGWTPAYDVDRAIADLWASEELPPALVERYRS
jgi:UDP-glucose 4-epimerase